MAFKIYEEPKEKEWAFKSFIDDDGHHVTSAVDAQTGKLIANIFVIDPVDGCTYVPTNVESRFEQTGYNPRPLEFDIDGSIRLVKT
jgi:hypothetical protein